MKERGSVRREGRKEYKRRGGCVNRSGTVGGWGECEERGRERRGSSGGGGGCVRSWGV
jgi:hypothetical protein